MMFKIEKLYINIDDNIKENKELIYEILNIISIKKEIYIKNINYKII